MKKRTFVLIELFLAIGLVTLFSLPLVRGHSYYVKRQKERLFALEKERIAEKLFYEICASLVKEHPLSEISAAWKTNPSSFQDKTVTIDLGKLGKKMFYWDYHLYSNTKKENKSRKLRIQICFKDNPSNECIATEKFSDASYGFVLTSEYTPKNKT